MQINRLSPGLQEELKTATNYNTARNETLFQYQAAGAVSSGASGNQGNKKDVDFSKLDTRDLNITPEQIEGLLADFSDEVIKVFSSDLILDNPLREQNNTQENGTPTFTA
ncbi:MAG: hypothetical protein KHX03_00740 [Clostridium sp.]|nr:hypothetical protein [Clostridium sp.]